MELERRRDFFMRLQVGGSSLRRWCFYWVPTGCFVRFVRRLCMHSRSLQLRFSVCAALLIAGTVLLHALGHGEPVLRRQQLANFPINIGARSSFDVPITDRILKAVGVDDYLNRQYASAGVSPISLYVGYYKSQRTGD